MMKENIPHLRRQKDLVLRWKILTQGAELPLEGRDLQLEVTMPGGASHRIPCPDREGCSIVQRLSGRDLTRCGLYSLTLWENFGLAGQTAVDARHAFCLVPTTDDELLPSAPDIDSLSIDTVQIETASLDIPADMLSGLLERLTRAEQDIEVAQQRLAAMGVKQLGVFGSVQAGYDAAAEDAVCENEQIGIIMFSHGEPYHNNYVILQTVNRSHYITTQTMLMEGHSAKSWTRRIVLGGNKEVGPWRQVNGMVESFHLNGTRLMGRTPGEAEVQLVDLAPIIPQVPDSTGGGFELVDVYTNFNDMHIWRGQIGTLEGKPVMRAVVNIYKGGSYIEGYGFSMPPLDFFYHLFGSMQVPTSAMIISISGTAKDGSSNLRTLSIEAQGSGDIAYLSSTLDSTAMSSPHLIVKRGAVTRVTIVIDYIASLY